MSTEFYKCIEEWADRCKVLSDESAALRAKVEEQQKEYAINAETIQQYKQQLAAMQRELAEAKCGEALCGHDHSTQYWELRANKAEQQLAAVEQALKEEHAQHYIWETAWEKQFGELQAREATIARLVKGECVKCNMDPVRTACAYPEACEHPGLKLAMIYNQSLLTIADKNRELNEQRDRVVRLEGALKDAKADAKDSSNEVRWQERQGEDYGSY